VAISHELEASVDLVAALNGAASALQAAPVRRVRHKRDSRLPRQWQAGSAAQTGGIGKRCWRPTALLTDPTFDAYGQYCAEAVLLGNKTRPAITSQAGLRLVNLHLGGFRSPPCDK
jgi:hypothetical protein